MLNYCPQIVSIWKENAYNISKERNMTLTNSTAQDQSAASVVAKAVLNDAYRLGLSLKDLSEVLGLSQGQISKLKTGDATLMGKAFDIAV